MSGYYLNVTLDDVNKALTAVSSIGGSTCDDVECRDAHDVTDVSKTLAAVGDIVKASIVSTAERKSTTNSITDVKPSNKLTEGNPSLSTQSDKIPGYGSYKATIESLLVDKSDLSFVKALQESPVPTPTRRKDDILDSPPLKGSPIDKEIEKLTIKLKDYEVERTKAEQNSNNLVKALETAQNRILELEQGKIQSNTEKICLENTIRGKDAIIESIEKNQSSQVSELLCHNVKLMEEIDSFALLLQTTNDENMKLRTELKVSEEANRNTNEMLSVYANKNATCSHEHEDKRLLKDKATESSDLNVDIEQLHLQLQSLHIKLQTFDDVQSENKKLVFDCDKMINLVEKKDIELAALEKMLCDSVEKSLKLSEDLKESDSKLIQLQTAVSATDMMHEQNQIVLTTSLDNKIRMIQAKFKIDLEETNASWTEKLNEIQDKLDLTDRLLEAAYIEKKKAELGELEMKLKTQKTIETFLHNGNEDVVDRSLIANLLVTYFKKNKSREVMELISKVLRFNEEQKYIVGLTLVTSGLRQTMGSMFKSIISTSPKKRDNVETENRSDLWIDFLLAESKGNKDEKRAETREGHVEEVPRELSVIGDTST